MVVIMRSILDRRWSVMKSSSNGHPSAEETEALVPLDAGRVSAGFAGNLVEVLELAVLGEEPPHEVWVPVEDPALRRLEDSCAALEKAVLELVDNGDNDLKRAEGVDVIHNSANARCGALLPDFLVGPLEVGVEG